MLTQVVYMIIKYTSVSEITKNVKKTQISIFLWYGYSI